MRDTFAETAAYLEPDEAQPSESTEETAEDREAFNSLCRTLIESTVKTLRLIADNTQPVPVDLICAEMLRGSGGFSDEWIRREMDESVAEAAGHLRDLHRLLEDKPLYGLNESNVQGLAREARIALMAYLMEGIEQYRKEIPEIDQYLGGRQYWVATFQSHIDSAKNILDACRGTDALFESGLDRLLQDTQAEMDRFTRTAPSTNPGLVAPA
jgi:hypothetical protein